MNDKATQPTNVAAESVAAVREQLFPLVQKSAAEPLRVALGYVEVATDFKILTQDDATLAGEQLRALVQFRKSTDAARMEITRPLDAMKKEFIEVFDPAMQNANKAEMILRSELTRWIEEQNRLAEIERKKQEAIAEEARRKAESDLRREQERHAELKTEEAKVKSEIRQVELEAKVEETQVSAAPMVAPAKIAGVSVSYKYEPEYHSKMDLIKAAAADPKYAIYLDFDDKRIGQVVRAMKEDSDIPGVRVKKVATSRVR